MSDPVVQFQDWIAQLPSWMVAGIVGFIVVVVAIVVWKAMKIAVTALAVAVVVAGGWILLEHFSGSGSEEPEPTVAPFLLKDSTPPPAVEVNPTQTQTPAPARPPPKTP